MSFQDLSYPVANQLYCFVCVILCFDLLLINLIWFDLINAKLRQVMGRSEEAIVSQPPTSGRDANVSMLFQSIFRWINHCQPWTDAAAGDSQRRRKNFSVYRHPSATRLRSSKLAPMMTSMTTTAARCRHHRSRSRCLSRPHHCRRYRGCSRGLKSPVHVLSQSSNKTTFSSQQQLNLLSGEMH